LTVVVLAIVLCVSTSTIVASYVFFKNNIHEHSKNTMQFLANTVARLVTAEQIDSFIENGPDEEYEKVLDTVTALTANIEIDGIFVVYITVDDWVFVIDSRAIPYDVGERVMWRSGAQDSTKKLFLSGEFVSTDYFESTRGVAYTSYANILRENGEVAPGYFVGIDASLVFMSHEIDDYFSQSAVFGMISAVLFSSLFVVILHFMNKKRVVVVR
jgi:hypothetical protein